MSNKGMLLPKVTKAVAFFIDGSLVCEFVPALSQIVP